MRAEHMYASAFNRKDCKDQQGEMVDEFRFQVAKTTIQFRPFVKTFIVNAVRNRRLTGTFEFNRLFDEMYINGRMLTYSKARRHSSGLCL